MSSREGGGEGGMVALFMLLFLLLLLLLATLIGIGHKDINFACGIVNRAKLPHLEALWACPRAPPHATRRSEQNLRRFAFSASSPPPPPTPFCHLLILLITLYLSLSSASIFIAVSVAQNAKNAKSAPKD